MVSTRVFPIVCIVLSILSACASKQTELVKVVDWSADDWSPWKGRTREEVVALLGQPSKIEPDGKGGELYFYELAEERGNDGARLSPDVPGFGGELLEAGEVLGLFGIDEDGVIYKSWLKTGAKRIDDKVRYIPPSPDP